MPSIDFQTFLNCQVDVTPIVTDMQNKPAFRMKGIKDTLWFNNYSEINILKAESRTRLRRVWSFQAPRLNCNGHEYQREITSVTDTKQSPVIALHARTHTEHPFQHIDEGLLQVDYDGTHDCVIAGGPFDQITCSLFDDTLVCGIRNLTAISFYKLDTGNAKNKWIHVRNIHLDGEYTRIQMRRNTVLVGGKEGSCLHEIDINSGKTHFRICFE